MLSSLKTAKTRHPDCQVVRRRGRVYVICKQTHVLKLYKANSLLIFSGVSCFCHGNSCSLPWHFLCIYKIENAIFNLFS
nr:50S ribosomal protein L36 [Providencia sp. G1(2023)]